jgi:Family of unknown function (DUF5329)
MSVMKNQAPPTRLPSATGVTFGRRRVLVGLLVGLLATPIVWAAPSAAEHERIEALLQAVALRTDIQFVREGTAYTSAEAGRFLRAKLAAQGAGVTSAEMFIAQVASRSSRSGRPYTVSLPAGRQQSAEDFLRGELARIDAGLPSARPAVPGSER